MHKIMFIEGDPAVSALIAATLDMAGLQHVACLGSSEAMFCLQTDHFDLILLDIKPDDTASHDLAEMLGSRETPLILMTERDNVADRVRALKTGNGDYILKPFEPAELIGRITNVLARPGRECNRLQYLDIIVDLTRREVRQNDRLIALTPKEFDLLVLLFQHVNVALSRERILQTVWGYCFIGETRTVDMHIMQLRKKLDFHQKLKSVIKIGYRLDH